MITHGKNMQKQTITMEEVHDQTKTVIQLIYNVRDVARMCKGLA